eukprot:s1760_g3.t1
MVLKPGCPCPMEAARIRGPLWTQSQSEARRGSAFVQFPPGGFDSTDLLVRWLLDLRLRSRLTEATYSTAIAISRTKGPPWHKALNLLEAMQKVQLEARAAACTAAMRACRSGDGTGNCLDCLDADLKKSWAVALGFFEKMVRWSIRPYDGTGAALGLCEAMMERWQGALAHLAGMQQKGVSRLIRSHAAVAEACESSLADWRLSAELLETTEQLSQDQGGPERFLQDTIPTKIMTYSRGAYWNVALQVHQSSCPRSMSVQAYNALMRACGLRAGCWDVVLRFLAEMYSEDLMPDSDTFTSAMEACGAANEWEWILQLYEELQLQNLPPSPRSLSLARHACEVLGVERKVMDFAADPLEIGVAENG